MPLTAEERKAAAEKRRAKILARSSERLGKITGAYAADPKEVGDAPVPDAGSSTSTSSCGTTGAVRGDGAEASSSPSSPPSRCGAADNTCAGDAGANVADGNASAGKGKASTSPPSSTSTGEAKQDGPAPVPQKALEALFSPMVRAAEARDGLGAEEPSGIALYRRRQFEQRLHAAEFSMTTLFLGVIAAILGSRGAGAVAASQREATVSWFEFPLVAFSVVYAGCAIAMRLYRWAIEEDIRGMGLFPIGSGAGGKAKPSRGKGKDQNSKGEDGGLLAKMDPSAIPAWLEAVSSGITVAGTVGSVLAQYCFFLVAMAGAGQVAGEEWIVQRQR